MFFSDFEQEFAHPHTFLAKVFRRCKGKQLIYVFIDIKFRIAIYNVLTK